MQQPPPPDDDPELAAHLAPHEHPDHHVLREPEDGDRWEWRRRIRRNPVALFWYRVGVAVAGFLVMLLAVLLGPLPGPGGIPMFLVGLAIWASEFTWAHRVRLWFMRFFHWFAQASRRQQVAAVAGVLVVAWASGYLSMVVLGPPGWLPARVRDLMVRLPGI